MSVSLELSEEEDLTLGLVLPDRFLMDCHYRFLASLWSPDGLFIVSLALRHDSFELGLGWMVSVSLVICSLQHCFLSYNTMSNYILVYQCQLRWPCDD